MNTALKDTKVAQHFTVPMFRLMWQVLLGVVGIVGLYFALINNVSTNAQGIDTNKIKIDITSVKLDKHLDDIKSNPVAEAQLVLKMSNIEDDVKDHDIKLNNHETKITENSIMRNVIRQDQLIMKDDIKEILKILKPTN